MEGDKTTLLQKKRPLYLLYKAFGSIGSLHCGTPCLSCLIAGTPIRALRMDFSRLDNAIHFAFPFTIKFDFSGQAFMLF
jgi:hypothetical protein